MSGNGRKTPGAGPTAAARNTPRKPPPRPWYLYAFGYLALMAIAVGIGTYVAILSQPSNQPLFVNNSLPIPNPFSPPTSPAPGEKKPPVILVHGQQLVPIIMYHDVIRRMEVSFDLTTREFTRQMDDLAKAGANPISIQDLYDHLASGKPLPEHPILLTFDDCTLGQFTDALPILKKHQFPATFFVQTASVGVTTGKDHMTWDQLKQAEATGLITVESHTITHPEDLTKLSDGALDKEFQESRSTLEQQMGHPVLFLAYPSGTCDSRVGQAAMRAGYLAAVTMDRGWAASPAQSYFLPRFAPQRVPDIITAWQKDGPVEPPLPRLVNIQDSPLEMGVFDGGETPIEWIAGGQLTTEAINGRKTVGEMALAANAQAALNGTFFADARVQSVGSAMVGPVLCSVNDTYKPDTPAEEDRIMGRPMLLFAKDRCLITPFYSHLGQSANDITWLMPSATDAFLAGGWIVHFGRAVPKELLRAWSTHDADDPRHRAFVGIDSQNRYLLGATQESVSTEQVASSLEKMGVQEAFLLDSGFSTSLIWQNHVLVSGHSRKDVPSRPVPHALFLMGPVAPGAIPPPVDSPLAAGTGAASTEDAIAADSTAGAAHYSRHRRRGR